jgi:hypothetical protein
MIQPLELTAFALPVPDRVLDEFKLRSFPEVCNRKYRSENRLKTGVLAFSRKKVHLKKAIVRLSLNLDEIRYSNRRFDSRKIVSFPADAVTSIS